MQFRRFYLNVQDCKWIPHNLRPRAFLIKSLETPTHPIKSMGFVKVPINDVRYLADNLHAFVERCCTASLDTI